MIRICFNITWYMRVITRWWCIWIKFKTSLSDAQKSIAILWRWQKYCNVGKGNPCPKKKPFAFIASAVYYAFTKWADSPQRGSILKYESSVLAQSWYLRKGLRRVVLMRFLGDVKQNIITLNSVYHLIVSFWQGVRWTENVKTSSGKHKKLALYLYAERCILQILSMTFHFKMWRNIWFTFESFLTHYVCQCILNQSKIETKRLSIWQFNQINLNESLSFESTGSA